MNTNMLTTDDLTARLEVAKGRLQRAKATTVQLERALAEADRKRAAHQKIALGAALLRAAESNPDRLPGLRNLVLTHITRDVDWNALEGTPFAREVGNA